MGTSGAGGARSLDGGEGGGDVRLGAGASVIAPVATTTTCRAARRAVVPPGAWLRDWAGSRGARRAVWTRARTDR